MTSTGTNKIKAAALIVIGVAIAVTGVYVANADDAPGSAAMDFVVMFAAIVLAVKILRNGLPRWAGRTALAAGAIIAAFAGFLTFSVAARAPLFGMDGAQQPQDVPSVADATLSPPDAAAVERARALVRAAILEQNLPGLSVAVGAGGTLVWAEGFGWRDVRTETPVTPNTRFNIGTAASAVTAADVTRLGLRNTGAEPAMAWSPEAIGEEGEDFPPLTLMRHNVFQPLGLMPLEYPIPGERATFYVPRSDDNDPRRGRRMMFMRDLACCANGMASYSTAPDLVRVGLANGASINGELAGGMVTSLLRGDNGIVVAVLSNMAYADTAALASSIAAAFTAR